MLVTDIFPFSYNIFNLSENLLKLYSASFLATLAKVSYCHGVVSVVGPTVCLYVCACIRKPFLYKILSSETIDWVFLAPLAVGQPAYVMARCRLCVRASVR